MHPFYKEFKKHLDAEDKDQSVRSVLSLLSAEKIDIRSLYCEVLTPALRNIKCSCQQEVLCIWKEHVQSSIVRTIIECAYPFVLQERDRSGRERQGKVIVVCPNEEYHEIGARMVADFFTIAGYEVVFIGANTPKDDILKAVKFVKPSLVAISVTSLYNLVPAKKIIQTLAEIRLEEGLKMEIVVGGDAFSRNPQLYQEIGADRMLSDISAILKS